MATMNGDGSAQDICVSGGSTRRVLVAAGAGWVLSAAGLFLPAAGDEAEARNGTMDGKFGGRRGKDHRGRDKHRGKNRNAGDNNGTSHDEGLFDPANISLTVQNFTSSGIQILHTSGDLREWRSVAGHRHHGATGPQTQRRHL